MPQREAGRFAQLCRHAGGSIALSQLKQEYERRFGTWVVFPDGSASDGGRTGAYFASTDLVHWQTRDRGIHTLNETYAGMDSEKVGVLEAGQTVGLALRRQNEAGIMRCKLVILSNGVVCWCAD